MAYDLDITLSVVSHGQMGFVRQLLGDIERHCKGERIELILTLNVATEATPDLSEFTFPVRLMRNTVPLGFGANHNQAFKRAKGAYFCVLNPDIRLDASPFPRLIAELSPPYIGVAAPLVLALDGTREDSARRFPTPLAILRRIFVGAHPDAYGGERTIYQPDWVGGMFMLFPKGVYQGVGGFDERYFMYYEDVDICARLKLCGWNSLLCADAKVTHDAQRSSHKSLRYLRWHVSSMLRFFTSITMMRLWRRGYL
jgi:hypothetical protein